MGKGNVIISSYEVHRKSTYRLHYSLLQTEGYANAPDHAKQLPRLENGNGIRNLSLIGLLKELNVLTNITNLK